TDTYGRTLRTTVRRFARTIHIETRATSAMVTKALSLERSPAANAARDAADHSRLPAAASVARAKHASARREKRPARTSARPAMLATGSVCTGERRRAARPPRPRGWTVAAIAPG